MRILFVCTGNTCRSTMAEGLFRHMIKEKGLEDRIKVESAGVFAALGQSASYQSIEVMKGQSIDISNHKSRQLTKEMIENADIILAMTNNHKRAIESIDIRAIKKTFTLTEYAYGNERSTDIMDPFGASVQVYEQCSIEIKNALVNIVEKLVEKIEEENK
ncbi:MAG: low molecular weight protein arginine phosphatase [Tissierellales bacterium]